MAKNPHAQLSAIVTSHLTNLNMDVQEFLFGSSNGTPLMVIRADDVFAVDENGTATSTTPIGKNFVVAAEEFEQTIKVLGTNLPNVKRFQPVVFNEITWGTYGARGEVWVKAESIEVVD